MSAARFAMIVAVCAFLCPTSGNAADSSKEQAKIRKITFDYAACVVRKHHEKASEAILATASNQAILGDLSQIIDSECLVSAAGYGVDMRFPNDSYKFALADALVNADFLSKGQTSFDDRLPLAQPVAMSSDAQAVLLAKIKSDRKRKDLQEQFTKSSILGWIARYGECVVRQDPVNARYWVLTRPDTPEETSRIKAMQPAFGLCLGSGTMKFNRVTMRGTVAINYYRLAMATVVSGAGSAH